MGLLLIQLAMHAVVKYAAPLECQQNHYGFSEFEQGVQHNPASARYLPALAAPGSEERNEGRVFPVLHWAYDVV